MCRIWESPKHLRQEISWWSLCCFNWRNCASHMIKHPITLLICVNKYSSSFFQVFMRNVCQKKTWSVTHFCHGITILMWKYGCKTKRSIMKCSCFISLNHKLNIVRCMKNGYYLCTFLLGCIYLCENAISVKVALSQFDVSVCLSTKFSPLQKMNLSRQLVICLARDSNPGSLVLHRALSSWATV